MFILKSDLINIFQVTKFPLIQFSTQSFVFNMLLLHMIVLPYFAVKSIDSPKVIVLHGFELYKFSQLPLAVKLRTN